MEDMIEQSNQRNLKPSDFSYVYPSDFQISGTFCSLSLPSEPHDIRNWFSSYVYESPELDSYDSVRDSFAEKGNIRKDELDVEKSDGEVVENIGGFLKIKKGGGEPPDKKLDSPEFPQKFRSICADAQHESQSLSKDHGSWRSMSLLSGPHDITNWFQSYKYESPALGESDEFGYSVPQEFACDSVGFPAEESNRDKEESWVMGDISRDEVTVNYKANLKAYGGNINDNRREKLVPYRVDDRPGENEDLSFHLRLESTGEKTPQEKILQNRGINPTKDDRSSCPESESSQCKLQKKVSHDTSYKLLFDRTSTKAELPPENGCQFMPPDVPSIGKPTDGRNGKENRGTTASNKGFVTTKKCRLTRENEEIFVQGPQYMINKVTSSRESGNMALVNRPPLAQRTNLQNLDRTEVTGKWKCPRKGKQNLGPSLKQLRLEQWVRRA